MKTHDLGVTACLLCLVGWLPACAGSAMAGTGKDLTMSQRVEQYAPVRLESDLSGLSAAQKRMIPHLIEAGRAMDEIFWLQAYGEQLNAGGDRSVDQNTWLKSIRDGATRRFAQINYGPWDRLGGNAPFLPHVGEKPKGAGFYPADMSAQEFEQHIAAHPDQAEAFKSQYTMIRRDDAGRMKSIPYHVYFKEHTARAITALRSALKLAEDPGFKAYLEARIEALKTDEYRHSDMLWLDMKSNTIDIVVGPIETYEDQLFGYKAAHEAYVLIKDKAWSARLSRYAALLPGLQRELPADPKYKQEEPGTDSELNAYDVVYYAGDCNAGAKTIAINLPNDEVVQLQKGTRRLQLQNAMRAKFDRILVPLSETLIAGDQRKHITFEAFFGNTMFHEVAHGLGIKNTVNGRGTVREALKEQASALEEGKADILGLFMVTRLFEQGILTDGSVMDHYVTFLASIFRSVRFGASSAHGRANMLRFNFFEQYGAFSRGADGTYRVDFDKMRAAMEALSARILQLQGDGDYAGTVQLMKDMGNIGPGLQADLDRLQGAGIPVDIVFEQGVDVLGLK